jgi:uncharacterized protein (TIGR02118 family)
VYKLIAIWSAPEDKDVEAFEQAYNESHVPLAAAVPDQRRLVLTRTDVGLEGAPPAFFRVAEMVFDSQEALDRAEHSDEWRRLREDAGGMIERFGVTLSVGMGDESEHPLAG